MARVFKDSEGWTFDFHARDLDLFSIPSKVIAENSVAAVRLVNIAHAKGMTRRVYFVDIFDKRCLVTKGQFKTQIEALEYWHKLTEESK